MKKLIAGLLVVSSFLIFGIADGQTPVKPYKWVPIPGLIVHGAKGYIDLYSLRAAKTDSGRAYHTATLLTTFDEPMTVTSNKGTKKTGSSVISYVVVDCSTGNSGTMDDFLLTEKMPTKQSIPVASMKYAPTEENTIHLEKGSPMFVALCPAEI